MAKVTPSIIKSHTYDSATISISSLGPLFLVQHHERHEGSSDQYFEEFSEAVEVYAELTKEAAAMEIRLEHLNRTDTNIINALILGE